MNIEGDTAKGDDLLIPHRIPFGNISEFYKGHGLLLKTGSGGNGRG